MSNVIPKRYYDEANPHRTYDRVTLENRQYLVHVKDRLRAIEIIEEDESFTAPVTNIRALKVIRERDKTVLAKPVKSKPLLERLVAKIANDETMFNPPLE